MRRKMWPILRKRRQDMASRTHSASNSRRRRLLLLASGSYAADVVAEPLSPCEEVSPPTLIRAYVPPEGH